MTRNSSPVCNMTVCGVLLGDGTGDGGGVVGVGGGGVGDGAGVGCGVFVGVLVAVAVGVGGGGVVGMGVGDDPPEVVACAILENVLHVPAAFLARILHQYVVAGVRPLFSANVVVAPYPDHGVKFVPSVDFCDSD